MIPSVEQIQSSFNSTLSRAAYWLPHLQYACKVYEIDTVKRLAAFLAQIAHESGRLVYVKEIWGPTESQRRYEYRKDLGNTELGDGKRYLGRGLIQITGRANYASVRDGLREIMTEVPDFELYPEDLEKPAFAALSAAWFWHVHGLNKLADNLDFKTITRRINGGLNGYNDRLALYNKTLQALA
jgi:putative chitinase